MLLHAPGAFPCLTFIVRQQLPLLSEQLRVTFCLVTKETVVILKRNTFLSLSGVCIHVGHRPQTDRVCRMSICFFSRHDKCPITFLSVRLLSIFFFFGNSPTSQSRSCDWLFAQDPNLHPNQKHSQSHLFLDSLTQCYSLNGTGLQCRIG